MWWHLRAGQVMLQSRTILLTDAFSYTRTGAPWVNAFWISEVVFFLLYKLGGFFALTLLVAVTGAATFYQIFRRTNGNIFVNAFVIILAALTAAPIWSPRPQILSFFILAVLDGFITKKVQRNDSRQLWVLLPLFALWANVHGGWIWGFLLLLATIVGAAIDSLSRDKRFAPSDWKFVAHLTTWSIGAGLAISLNPNGIAIWRLPFYTANVSMQIQEWASPDFHQIEFQPMLWMIFLLTITAVLGKPKTNWVDLLKLTGFAYLTFVSERSIAVFAIIAAPILAEWANAAFDNLKKDFSIKARQETKQLFPEPANKVVKVILVAAIVLAALGRAYLVSSPAEVNKNLPAGAIAWLEANPMNGHLFNSYNWGGYLAWALPQTPVFIDGRADLYGSEMINEWWSVVDGTPQGFGVLDKWNVQGILLEPNWPIVKLLPTAGWREVYRDQTAVLFARGK